MSWTVDKVMTERVVTARPVTPYKRLVELMGENRISALPVVDVVGSRGGVVGIVSEADLLIKEEYGKGAAGKVADLRPDKRRAAATVASDLMTSPVVSIRPGATLAEAARLMHERGVKRLPVIDEQGHLVGIVSRSDLLKAFTRSDESIRQEIEDHVLRHVLVIEPGIVTVTAARGVVTLEGELETSSLTRILVRLVESMEGVVTVENLLRSRFDDTRLRPDESPLAVHYAASERP